ncbi:MAG TPA: hypothetical protein VF292_03460 [Rhodanobacteraceae bacterium]
MSSSLAVSPSGARRWLAAAPFIVTGAIAVAAWVALALVAAPLLAAEGGWLAAYLGLIAGAAQVALGGGQAWLALQPPEFEHCAYAWAALNLGNVGIIAGSLLGAFWIVVAGTAAFVLALALFTLGVRRTARPLARVPYWALLVFLAVMALVGLIFAVVQFRA